MNYKNHPLFKDYVNNLLEQSNLKVQYKNTYTAFVTNQPKNIDMLVQAIEVWAEENNINISKSLDVVTNMHVGNWMEMFTTTIVTSQSKCNLETLEFAESTPSSKQVTSHFVLYLSDKVAATKFEQQFVKDLGQGQ